MMDRSEIRQFKVDLYNSRVDDGVYEELKRLRELVDNLISNYENVNQ